MNPALPNDPSGERAPRDGSSFDLDALLADAAKPTEAARLDAGFSKRVMTEIAREEAWRASPRRWLRWAPLAAAAAVLLSAGAFVAGRRSAAPAPADRGLFAKAVPPSEERPGLAGLKDGESSWSDERRKDAAPPPANAPAPAAGAADDAKRQAENDLLDRDASKVAGRDAPAGAEQLQRSLDEAAPSGRAAGAERSDRYREIGASEPSQFAEQFPRSADGRVYAWVNATAAEIAGLLPADAAAPTAQVEAVAAQEKKDERREQATMPQAQAPPTQQAIPQDLRRIDAQQRADAGRELEARVFRLSKEAAEKLLAQLAATRRDGVRPLLRDAEDRFYVVGEGYGPITPPRRDDAEARREESAPSQSQRQALSKLAPTASARAGDVVEVVLYLRAAAKAPR